MKSHAVLAAAMVIATGCAGGLEPGALKPGAELCYRIEANAAAQALRLPWGFALTGDPVPLPQPGDRRTAWTLTEAGERQDHPFHAWWISEDGSVQVGTLSLGAIQLTLTPEEGVLRGSGRPIGDAVPPRAAPRSETQGVVAHGVECRAGQGRPNPAAGDAKPHGSAAGSRK